MAVEGGGVDASAAVGSGVGEGSAAVDVAGAAAGVAVEEAAVGVELPGGKVGSDCAVVALHPAISSASTPMAS